MGLSQSERRVASFLLVAAVALFLVSSGVSASSRKSPPARTLSSSCTRTVHVYIVVFAYYPDLNTVSPHPGPCWDHNRVVQSTNQFTVCHYNLNYTGNGPSGWFDDTNPTHDVGQETTAIDQCSVDDGTFGILFAEDMAARDSPQTSWCQNNGYTQPCWRRNDDIVGVSHKFAELYSSDSTVWDYWNQWLSSGGYGANPSNSRPLINIRPISGNNAALNADVTALCNEENTGGYVGIYASNATRLLSSDFSEINTIFNNCTG